MKDKIKIIIVGCGTWGKKFLNLVNTKPLKDNFKISGIVSRRKENLDLQKLSKKHDFKIFDNLEEALFSLPEGVFISTPDDTHLEVLEKIILFCKKKDVKCPNIFVEKPLGRDIKKTYNCLKKYGYKPNHSGDMIPSQSSPFIMVDWHKKYSPQQRYANEIINKNVKKLNSIRVRYLDKRIVFSKNYLSWFRETNLFSFLLGHFVELIFYSLGRDYLPISVNVSSFFEDDVMLETIVTLCIGSKDSRKKNILASFVVSCNEPFKSYSLTEQDITYTFSDSRICVDTTGRDLEIIDSRGIRFKNVHGELTLHNSLGKENVTIGYIYGPQIDWLDSIKNILSKKSNVKKLSKKYPLNIFPELIINACEISLKKGLKLNNIILGAPIKIDSKKLNFSY